MNSSSLHPRQHTQKNIVIETFSARLQGKLFDVACTKADGDDNDGEYEKFPERKKWIN